MPVGIDEWRAGIAFFCKYGLLTKVSVKFPGGNFLSSVYCLAYLYVFIWLSVVTLPLSVLVTSFLSFSSDVALQDPVSNFINITLYNQVTVCFVISRPLRFFHEFITLCQKCPAFRKRVLDQAQRITHFAFVMTCLACVSLEDVFSLNFLLLLSGDIETSPCPHTDNCLKFFHWNLNSLCARDNIKISLIEAYNSIHRFDVIALSESMLNSSISNEDIFIEGFSKEIYRNDHPSNTKKGGVCLYFREGLPIKRRTDLELVQEMIVTEITIARKKIFFITVYRSPSQNSEQFEHFIASLQMTLNQIQREKPQSLFNHNWGL